MAKVPTNNVPGAVPDSKALETVLDPVASRMLYFARLQQGEAMRKVPDDADFRDRYPNLFEWLTATQIADEFKKEPARLSIAASGTTWEISLSDSSLMLSLSYTGNTLSDGLSRLEAGLTDKDAPWRTWKRGDRKLRRIEKPV